MPALAKSDGSRLLWYLRLAHGSGQAYTIVTITGCRDATDWAELAERVRGGDLAAWSAKVDGMRHGCEAKVVQPVPWSPLREIDFSSVPVDGATHDNSLFMEDTAWPFAGGLQAYLDKAGTLYDHTLSSQKEEGTGMIELEAAFQPIFGTHKTTEVILWQRVVNAKAVMWMLRHDLPKEASAPGTWLHDALGGAGPLGEPAAAQRGVVAALLKYVGNGGGGGRRCGRRVEASSLRQQGALNPLPKISRGRLRDEVLERRPIHGHHHGLGDGDERRSLGCAGECAHLAEELARAMPRNDDVLPVPFAAHLDLAVDDDEEALRTLPLPHDHLTGLEGQMGELGAERSWDRGRVRRRVHLARLHRHSHTSRVLEVDEVQFEGTDQVHIDQRLLGHVGDLHGEEGHGPVPGKAVGQPTATDAPQLADLAKVGRVVVDGERCPLVGGNVLQGEFAFRHGEVHPVLVARIGDRGRVACR